MEKYVTLVLDSHVFFVRWLKNSFLEKRDLDIFTATFEQTTTTTTATALRWRLREADEDEMSWTVSGVLTCANLGTKATQEQRKRGDGGGGTLSPIPHTVSTSSLLA